MEEEQTGKRQRLSKYELLVRLGQGGMGEVWKARDTELQRYVALKLLRADLRDDPEFTAYFTREARLVAALRHPNIVQIHDFQLVDQYTARSRSYMVMDYIEGGTLADAMRDTVRKGVFWSASEIVDLFSAISLALDYAHSQGMIHRDIKPANILLDRSLAPAATLGQPILTDFGIARWQGSGSTVTGFVGTPLYISPEQAQGLPVNARSDLYSLGIILYEVLTGRTPFRGDNPLAILVQHLSDQPPAPASLNPSITPALSAVVLQSIAKDPLARFPSAVAMTKALAQAFHVSAPVLTQETGVSVQSYNPLQPMPGRSGLAPLALSTDRAIPGAVSITELTPNKDFAPGAPGLLQSVDSFPRSLPGSETPVLPARRPSRTHGRAVWKWLLVVCILCLLLGIGIFAVGPRLAPASPSVASGVGSIRFSRSSASAQGPFNELQTNISHVPDPPAGQVYYAWLMQADSEASVPHWSLQVKHGAISDQHTASADQEDLLSASTLFLITEETSSSVPDIPAPSPAAHFYYAHIQKSTSATPTFVVYACPTSNVNSPTNPCL